MKYIVIYSGITIAFILGLFKISFASYLFSLSAIIYAIFLAKDIYDGELIFTVKIFDRLTDFFLFFVVLSSIFLLKEFNFITIILFLVCHLIKIFTTKKEVFNK